jgi:hypothetical protein
MKLYSIAFCLILLFSKYSYSQKENNVWYFGDHAGLDFNSGNPQVLTNGAMMTYDNCTSIADDITGQLLFYSNGIKVWNANHTPMPNGNGLMGNTTGGNSAFAVKQPDTSHIDSTAFMKTEAVRGKYYLFTSDAFAGSDGIRYSIIDMSLNGGFGDVTPTKNILLKSPATEKITAVTHANNKDVWVIIHPWNTSSFNAYLLTGNGLKTTPVVSNAGSSHSGDNYNAMGQISVSPTGDKIAVAIYNLGIYQIFDFNRSTGILSNPITISGYPEAWGLEFSPDGSKLYATQWTHSVINQFDLSIYTSSAIASSVQVVGNATGPSGYKAGYLQMGPDKKIYVAKFESEYLGVIKSPNLLGNACNFVDNGIKLGGKLSEAGLPAFTKKEFTTGIFENEFAEHKVSVYPNPFTSTVTLTISQEDFNKYRDSELTIFDITGKEVIRNKFSENSLSLSKSNLPQGFYIWKISNKKLILETGKLISK